MKYELFFISGVDNDIADATEWYENKVKGLGVKFLNDWETAISYIANNPFSYQIQKKVYRHGHLKKFPYVIVYEIESSHIYVYAVIHAKQQPKKRYLRTGKKK